MAGIFRHAPWHRRHVRRRVVPYGEGASGVVAPAGGAPTVTAFLDDGTGTFPHDVTAFLRLDQTVTISRGREDEFSATNPGRLDCVFDNSSGLFTHGSATYDIAVNQKIRVKVNGQNRFTGFVQSWPVSWQGGPGRVALARVSATDQWARLSRWDMRSLIEEEVLAVGADAYYTLGDPTGSTQAADSSGNATPAAALAGSGTAVVFGNATGPTTDGLTAAEFANGQYLATPYFLGATLNLRATVKLNGLPASSATVVELDNPSAIPGEYVPIIRIDSSGVVNADGLTGPNINDGGTHDVVLIANSSTLVDSHLYVDGVLQASAVLGTFGIDDTARLVIGESLTGVVSHVAAGFDDLTAAQVSNQYKAVNGHTSSSEYMTRIAVLTGTTVGTLDAGLTTPYAGSIDGMSAAAALQRIADAEVGAVFINGSGELEFRNRNSRPLNTSPDMTIDTATSELVSPSTQIVTDVQAVINYATAKAEPSSLTQTYKDQDSIDTHGRYKQDYTYAVTTDAEAISRAQWIVNANADPRPRIPDLSLDLLTASGVEQNSALALDIGSRLRVVDLPSQAPDTTVDLLVEGWTETIGTDEWSLALNTTDWSVFTAWILDDATYSVLGTTTKLYV